MYWCVGVLFHNTFKDLEQDGHLDPLNEVDMYCLHYVYILASFIESWNNHSLSSEHNLTPNQLFTKGALI